MIRQRTIGLTLGVALTVGLTACTGAPGGGTGDGTVKYLISTPEDSATLDQIHEDIANFTKETGVKVKIDTAPLEQLRTVLQTQLRSGSGPDVFRYDTGPGYAGALQKAGLLSDLTAASKNWQIYDFAKQRVTFDDRVVGIPDELETFGVFYNKDIFAENGIEEPKSEADLAAAARKLADAGVTPFAFGNQEGWPAFHIFSMALNSAIGPDGVQALIDGEESWDSPAVVDALDLVFRQFDDQRFYPESPNAINYDDMTALFISGSAAMAPTGTWLISDITENAQFDVGFFPFPGEDGAGVFTGGVGSGVFMSSTAQNKKGAAELMDYLASAEHGKFEVEQLQLIPAFPVETSGTTSSELFSLVLDETAEFATGGSELGVNIDVNMSDQFNKAMSDGIQALLNDEITAEDLAAQLALAATAD